jgi:hypothetical protein
MKKTILFALILSTFVSCGKKESVTLKSTPYDDSEVRDQLADHELRISLLEELMGSLQLTVEGLENRISVVENNYVELNVFNQTVIDLREELTTVINNVQQTSTEALEAAVALLQSQIDDNRQRIEDLENLVNDLNTSGLGIDEIVQFCPNADEVGIRLSDGRVLAFLQTVECASKNNCNNGQNNSIKLVSGRLSILEEGVLYQTTSASGNCTFSI